MSPGDRKLLIEEETLIVRHSGEIPEIALHGSIHYITEDDEGPRLSLTAEERSILEDAAIERFGEILLRDLDADNRDETIYRGVARSIANWQRFQSFCKRIDRDSRQFDATIAKALFVFLRQEIKDVSAGTRSSSINCSCNELIQFVVDLGQDPSQLPASWDSLCPSQEDSLSD